MKINELINFFEIQTSNDRNASTHLITTERAGLLPTNNKTAKKSALGIFRQFLEI